MPLPTVSHPEYPITSDTYLNIYSGLDNVDITRFAHYQSMTEEQKETYEQFWSKVQSETWEAVVPDEFTSLRFLQADQYDNVKALQRLRNNQVWLQSVNIPQLLQTPPEKLSTYRQLRSRCFLGRSEAGLPVFVERLGHFMNAISSKQGKSLSKEDFRDCFLYELGELLSQIRDSYTSVPATIPVTWTATWIMDCQGLSLWRATRATSTLQYLDGQTDPNFPELAGPIFLVHVPTIVSGVYKVVKAFLDPSVVAKITVHSSVPEKELRSGISEAVLLPDYGGSNTTAVLPVAEYS